MPKAGQAPVAPFYATGRYHRQNAGYDVDGPYKAADFLNLLHPIAAREGCRIGSYADVGCGGGSATVTVAEGLRERGYDLATARGFEVSPHIAEVRHPAVEFVHGDFTAADAWADLVTLFDVFEHVIDPIEFLRRVAARCGLIGLHIPLDDIWANGLFDRFGGLRANPGHLTYFDTASALNTVAFAGIRVLAHRYTHPYRWPTSRGTLAQRAAAPLRRVVATVNPWLASKMVGGISLMVLGITETGEQRRLLAGESAPGLAG